MIGKLIVAAVSVCLASGCGFASSATTVSAEEAQAVAALRWLDDADPQADADRALRAGRLALLTLGDRRAWSLR